MMWPEEHVPEDYLRMAKALIARDDVTAREYINLCKLAVAYIDTGKVDGDVRSDMALYIAAVWLRNRNIDEVDILNAIGGQFGEWEIPGTFVIDTEPEKSQWQRLMKWVDEADEKYA